MSKKIEEILELYKNDQITTQEGLSLIETAIFLAEEKEYNDFLDEVKKKVDKGFLVTEILKHVMPYMEATELGRGRGHKDCFEDIEDAILNNESIDDALLRLKDELKLRIKAEIA